MKSKKAVVSEKTVMLTLAIVGLIILLVFTSGIIDTTKDTVNNELCQDSVRQMAIQKKTLTVAGTNLVDKLGNPTTLSCQTNYVEISRSTTNTQTLKKVADETLECWTTFAKDDYELFDTSDGNYCLVCSHITDPSKKTYEGFGNFMLTEKPTGSTETYLEIINGATQQEAAQAYTETLSKIDTINIEEPLAVLFIMNKNAHPGSIREEGKVEGLVSGSLDGAIAGAVTGIALCLTGVGCGVTLIGVITLASGAGGGVGGWLLGSSETAEWNSQLAIIPYSKINELDCTTLEGNAGNKHLTVRPK